MNLADSNKPAQPGWYYEEHGQLRGPFSDEEIDSMLASGKSAKSTMLRRGDGPRIIASYAREFYRKMDGCQTTEASAPLRVSDSTAPMPPPPPDLRLGASAGEAVGRYSLAEIRSIARWDRLCVTWLKSFSPVLVFLVMLNKVVSGDFGAAQFSVTFLHGTHAVLGWLIFIAFLVVGFVVSERIIRLACARRVGPIRIVLWTLAALVPLSGAAVAAGGVMNSGPRDPAAASVALLLLMLLLWFSVLFLARRKAADDLRSCNLSPPRYGYSEQQLEDELKSIVAGVRSRRGER